MSRCWKITKAIRENKPKKKKKNFVQYSQSFPTHFSLKSNPGTQMLITQLPLRDLRKFNPVKLPRKYETKRRISMIALKQLLVS